MLKKWLLAGSLPVLLMWASGDTALAQERGRLTGRVTRAEGGGLGGVTVVINEVGSSTITESDGSYVFDGVPPGTYSVTFSLGEDSATENQVEVSAGATASLDKSVDWEVSVVETITVYSASRHRERIVEAPAAITVITDADIAREGAHGQIPKLLEFTPGADVTQSGVYDFNFNVRGFNSSLNRRVVTLIDGRDPAVPFLGAQEWAAISFPLDDLARAELVRGPSSALYGANAFSGVLNLTTKPAHTSHGGEARFTGGELDTTNVDFRWAGELSDGWHLKVLGGYHASGDFTRSRNETLEYSVPCTRRGELDCLALEAIPLVLESDNKVVFGGARLDRVTSSGSVFTLEGGYADLEGPVFQTGIGRVQLTDVTRPWARLNFTSAHWNAMAYYNGRDANDQRSLSSGAGLYLDSQNYQLELRTNWDFAGDRGRVVAGLSYGEEEIDSANEQGRQTLMFEPVDSSAFAAYGQVDYSLTDKLKLVLAGRWDQSDLHDSLFSPKGSLVFSATPNQTFRATYNEAFQVANYSEFFLQAAVALPVNLSALEFGICRPYGLDCGLSEPVWPMALGNKDLEVEKKKSWEIGYSGIWKGKVFVTADYYRSQVDNFITDLLPQLDTPLGRINPNFGPYQRDGVPPQLLAVLQSFVPILSNNLDGSPLLAAVSYTNFGRVDTQGIDVGVAAYLDNNWKVDLTYSWFDFEVKESIGKGFDPLLPNAPANKLAAGLSYTGDRFDAGVKFRWTDTFRWAVGPFVGDIEAYQLVDLSLNYRFNDQWQAGLNATNVFDEEHYQSFGGDIVARRTLGHVTFSW